MPNYKLTYFDGRGRAEVVRMLFTAGGIKFTDERVQNWPTGKEDAPLGQLPYLTVDDTKLPQSVSIARFVAKRVGLYGSDDLSQAKIDAIIDTITDLQNSYYVKVFSAKEGADRDEARKRYIAEEAPNHVAKIEKLIGLYGSNGFSVGTEVTWADLAVYEASNMLMAINSKLIESQPGILSVRKTVDEHPTVGPYLRTRPEAAF